MPPTLKRGPAQSLGVPAPSAPLSPGQAVAAIASHAVFGDGSVTAEEQETLEECLGDFHELWKQESRQDALDAVSQRIRKQGSDAVLEAAIASVPHHLQGPLLETVRELVESDGRSSDDEDDLLSMLSAHFVATRKPAPAAKKRA